MSASDQERDEQRVAGKKQVRAGGGGETAPESRERAEPDATPEQRAEELDEAASALDDREPLDETEGAKISKGLGESESAESPVGAEPVESAEAGEPVERSEAVEPVAPSGPGESVAPAELSESVAPGELEESRATVDADDADEDGADELDDSASRSGLAPRQARRLRIAAASILMVAAAAVLAVRLASSSSVLVVGVYGLLLILCGIVIELSRRGRTRLGSWILGAGLIAALVADWRLLP